MTATDTAVGTKNLTRDEAVERAGLLTVTTYDIALDLTDGDGGPGAGTFRCRTEVVFDCARPGAAVRIELAGVAVRSATLNGAPVDTGGWSATRGLPLTGLAATNVLVVEADFAYSTSGQGLHRAVDPVDGEVYVYTHFEPTAAQRVYACFDQPDLKATFTWRAVVPGHWRVVSNMPAAEESTDGRTRAVTFAPTPRISTYLAALCAGPFHEVDGEHDGIRLGLFCRRSMADFLEAEEILTLTRQGFDFFHERFGIRYPLPKYDQIFVPEYNTGAMENFGAVTFAEQRYLFRSAATRLQREQRASTILHEMAHIWLGNLVTMRWWDELWLKEALATWVSYQAAEQATRFTGAWTTFLLSRKVLGYEADQLSSTHPIHADVPDVATALANFDGITYSKGASFIKQLAAYVGVDTFVAGLREYFRAHLWGNASLADLVDALEAASGRELSAVIRRWLDTVDVDTLRPELDVDPAGRYRAAAVRQSTPTAYRTHRIAVGRYAREGDRLVRVGRAELEVTDGAADLPELVGAPVADLLLLNDDDLSYAKIRFDERSLRTLSEDLWRVDPPLSRALCHGAWGDMVRDAEMPARDHVRQALGNLARETDPVLLTAGLALVRRSLTYHTAPDWTSTGWRLLAEHARDALPTASVDGGNRLTWARAYASAARDEADLRTLRRWWDGSEAPEGLAVDTDLRWHLLHCLVALDAAGPAEIETTLAGDRTASGAAEAVTAYALVPTRAAKADAWRQLAGAEELPNWRAHALADGFQHPAHVALTAPYVERFFTDAEAIWRHRRGEVCQTLVPLVFPTHQVTRAVVAAADGWLAGEDRPGPLRRLVVQGRDKVVTALAARARDAADPPR